jgi:pilus assembly protein CpaC
VRVKAGLINALFSAFSLIVCAQPGLRAQASKPPAPAAAPSRDSVQELLVVVGRSTLIDCAHPVERVTVGLGGFVEATAISRAEILLNGKAPGETSLIIWETGGGRQIFNVTVRPSAYETDDRLAGIRREFEKDLP